MTNDSTDIAILKGLISLIKVNNGKFSDDDIKLLKGIYKIVNDRWITIHPHGDDSDDYRRIKLEDGETPKEAIKRVYRDYDSKKIDKYKDEQNKEVLKHIKNVAQKQKILEDLKNKVIPMYENWENLTNQEKDETLILLKEAKNAKAEFLNAREEENTYIKNNSRAIKRRDIAGVKQGKPMSFQRANSGNVNPSFSEDNYEYSSNCQSCVVAYEARRRGYNVKAVKRNPLNKTEQLATRTAWAFINPQTNDLCENENIIANTSEDLYNKLVKRVKQNERYTFGYNWQNNDENTNYNEIGGHIITMELNSEGHLQFYDPQDGAVVYGKDIINYLNNNNAIFSDDYPFELLRVDDKDFNEYFINEIVEKS